MCGLQAAGFRLTIAYILEGKELFLQGTVKFNETRKK